MDAIIAINQRIAAIQTRIAQLDPNAAAVATTVSVSAPPATSFSSVLGELVGTRSVGAASVVGSGKALVDSNDVPIAFKSYGNGKIPASALSTIEGSSHRLWEPAARSFEALRAAAKADGVTMRITDSYRSYDAQVDVAARKGLYSQGGLAAVPGTSRHGWGMALDLSLDSKAQAWMRDHAEEYGFVEAVPREPWHWEYHPTS